ncbi:MAG: RNA polymerase sigma factor region1.1 domain-containing protein, partial [Porphyromonadaceae bacterium]|nr:RNA polymerase sigma factor region1.1 domain-containing protein [Porphyromonadaceae bacterium]
MSGELQFLEKLKGILELGNARNRVLSVQDVEEYFVEDHLSKEQMSLVYDYLLTQKIAVSGYEKSEGETLSPEKKSEKLLEEDRLY